MRKLINQLKIKFEDNTDNEIEGAYFVYVSDQRGQSLACGAKGRKAYCDHGRATGQMNLILFLIYRILF